MPNGLSDWLRSLQIDVEDLGIHSFEDLFAVSALLDTSGTGSLFENPLYRAPTWS